MKKKIMTIAIALSALCVLPSVAQNPNDNNAGCNGRNETCTRAKERPNPYTGIELTPEQQTSLQQLDRGRRESRRNAAENARRDYLNKVKEVLTPEQYVIFLENVYVQAPDGPAVRPGNRDGARREGNRDGNRSDGDRPGNRGDRTHAHNAGSTRTK